ncbi:hypothetical protein [Nocardia sp. NPDC006630]|uniref:hypothetical protein n=1 Tax=Nocardia sp. NPDC006630 TaxID=3157181 RepID=UPI0033AE4BE4
MRTTRYVLTALMAAASIELATAAAVHAETGAATTPVGYRVVVDGTDVVATVESGSFADAGDGQAVVLRDSAAASVETVPLFYSLDGSRHPIRHHISDDGRIVRLTPDTTGVDRGALQPVASPMENQLAMNDLINSVSIGTSIGSLIGTVVGAVAGIGVGFALAGASCLVLSLGCVVAVLPIVALTAGVGGIAGLALGGAPTAAYSLFEYVRTLQAPAGTSKYGDYYQGRQPQVPVAGLPR